MAGSCGCVLVSAETVSGLKASLGVCLWAEESRFPDADLPHGKTKHLALT